MRAGDAVADRLTRAANVGQPRGLTFAEAIAIARRCFEHHFPKICKCCGRRFDSGHDYVTRTRHQGVVLSLDPSRDASGKAEVVGVLALATCPCGNTLAVGTQSLGPPERQALVEWVRHECRARRAKSSVVLNGLVDAMLAATAERSR